MKKASMLLQITIAIILAVLVGSLSGAHASFFDVLLVDIFGFFGQLFLNSLMLLVVPLVVSSIINGLGQMRGEHSLGSLGLKTFGFYFLSTSTAILIGLFFVNLFKPGSNFNLLGSQIDSAKIILREPQGQLQIFADILMKFVPTNIFDAAAKGNMLGIIFFSVLFGVALSKIDSQLSDVMFKFWKALFHIIMKMTTYIMKAMPFGVFCLVAKVIASQGLQSIQPLFFFFLTVFFALSLFMFVVLPLILKMCKLNPLLHFKAVAPALITAFSSSSSAATIPVTMECLEANVGVSNRISSFVVPLGTSFNMAGSALYECVAILFIAQAYGIDVPIAKQFAVFFLTLLTSIGVAGVPSGSLVGLMIILHTMGFPAEGLALIIPLDRILDMCRTTVNVVNDTACAAFVAKSEGERLHIEESV